MHIIRKRWIRGTECGRVIKITYLVLDQKLDTLDRSSCSLRDSGRNTSHCYRMSVTVPIINSAEVIRSIEIDGCGIVDVAPEDKHTQEIDNKRRSMIEKSAGSL